MIGRTTLNTYEERSSPRPPSKDFVAAVQARSARKVNPDVGYQGETTMRTEIRIVACCLIMMGAVEGLCFARGGRATAPRSDIYVSVKGRDSARGTKSAPRATLGAALSLVPDPLTSTVTIRMAPGTYKTAGIRGGAT